MARPAAIASRSTRPGVQNGSNVAANTVESAASAADSCRSIGTGTAAGFAARSGLAFVTYRDRTASERARTRGGERLPEMDGEPLSRWSPRRLDCERRLDHLDQHGRETGR